MKIAGSSRVLLWAAWAFLIACSIAGLYRYSLRTVLPAEVDAGPLGLEITLGVEEHLLLREVNGMTINRSWHIDLALAGRREGDTVVLGLERMEAVEPAILEEREVAVVQGYEPAILIALIFVAVTLLGLAAFLIRHRGRHPATIPLAAMLAFLGTSLALDEWGPALGPGILKWLPGVLWAYTYALVPPAMLSFASSFPQESGFWCRLGWLKKAAWIFGIALGTCISAGIITYVNVGSGIGYKLCLGCQSLLWIFLAASFLFAGMGLYFAYRRSTDWGTSNRIRWVLLGAVFGGIPPLVLIILPRAFELQPPLAKAVALLFMVLLPICLVISVVRHQLLDISVVLKQGLLYRPAVIVVYFLFGSGFVLLGFLFLKLIVPDLRLNPLTVVILVFPLLFFDFVFEPVRRRVHRIISMLFFRTKYSYGKTVRAFSDELDRSLTGASIFNHLQSKILQTVMPVWVQIVEGGEKWQKYWDSVRSTEAIEDPALRFPFHDQDGLELWLGPKRSGMIYHNYDKTLLETLVGMATTALQREVLQRQLLAEAAEKERLEALAKLKDDFLSLVSHDLRSPLAAITMSAALMIRKGEGADNELIHANAVRIERNAQQLGQMVERLLHAATVEAGRVKVQLESCRLAEVVSNTMERHQLMSEARKVNLVSTVPDDAIARVDPFLLQEAVSNLVDNAMKVSGEGTTITVGAESTEDGWELTVSDQGPGIPDGSIPTLFERGDVSGDFERTSGFGLGLFLVRRLVELQGGTVELRETSPEGTTFVVQLTL